VRKRRDRERGGFPGGVGGTGGRRTGGRRGLRELASDVALPFLGFTSFIRRAAGSSRAVELRFLLFWKHTKSENSRYCGCKGLKCFLFHGHSWAIRDEGGREEEEEEEEARARARARKRRDDGLGTGRERGGRGGGLSASREQTEIGCRVGKAQNYAMHKHARTNDKCYRRRECGRIARFESIHSRKYRWTTWGQGSTQERNMAREMSKDQRMGENMNTASPLQSAFASRVHRYARCSRLAVRRPFPFLILPTVWRVLHIRLIIKDIDDKDMQ